MRIIYENKGTLKKNTITATVMSNLGFSRWVNERILT